MSSNLSRKIDAMIERIRQQQTAIASTQIVFLYRVVDGKRFIRDQDIDAYEARKALGLPMILLPVKDMPA